MRSPCAVDSDDEEVGFNVGSVGARRRQRREQRESRANQQKATNKASFGKAGRTLGGGSDSASQSLVASLLANGHLPSDGLPSAAAGDGGGGGGRASDVLTQSDVSACHSGSDMPPAGGPYSSESVPAAPESGDCCSCTLM